MREALIDLDGRLKAMDGRLFIRRGQVVKEALEGGAGVRGRGAPHRRRLEPTRGGARRHCGRRAGRPDIELTAHPGITILDPER